MINVALVLERSLTVWPEQGVPYSQSQIHQPDGYRQDCSGYVSMCWATARPGYNTESLVTQGVMFRIGFDEIRPGDAVGKCGPGTTGNNGHIQIVVDYDGPGGAVTIRDQAGDGPGWKQRRLKRINPEYLPYRFVGITSGEDEDDMSFLIKDELGRTWLVNGEATTRSLFNPAQSEARAYWVPGRGGVRDQYVMDDVHHDQIKVFAVSDLPMFGGDITPPASSGGGGTGGGATPAQVSAAVRAELDRTGIESIPGRLDLAD
jgi:uncharacterized protein YbdZ (MbtH family)